MTRSRIAGSHGAPITYLAEQFLHLLLEAGLERQDRRAAPLIAERSHHHAPAAVLFSDHQIPPGARVGEEDLGEFGAPGHVADGTNIDAGLIAGNHEHRDSAVFGRRRIGAAQHVEPVGVHAERHPDLLPVDHPVVTVELGLGGEAGQVAAGVGLAEPLTPQLLDRSDLRQEPGLLLRRAELQQGGSEQIAAVDPDPVRGARRGVLHLKDHVLRQSCRRARRTPPAS